LFAPKHYTTTYLIDNNGHIINSWESDYEPGQSVYLLENGNILRCCFTKNQDFIGGGEGGGIEEYDWDGNLVWEFWYTSDRYLMHHDIEPLPNGNILALAVEKKSYDECIAAGFSPDALRDRELFPDYVIEIEKTGPKSGRIVWEWHVWDHLVENDVAAHPELIDVHISGRSAPAFWNHMNSIDHNEALDQILLSVRGSSEIWIIDHSTTTEEAAAHTGGRYGKGGDLLYRWGNPQAYKAGDASVQKLFEQHDAQWMESGCPGEGNILVFNNGPRIPHDAGDRRGRRTRGVEREGEYSSVDEIVPPIDQNGNYILKTGSAYKPKEPIWTYTAENPMDFYSEAISGAQRLPNGNTLICNGVNGIFFEVTPKGETVWEYVNPVVGDGPLKQGDSIPLDHRRHAMNAVFKIYRYAPNYPGLAGKDLTPKGTIIEEAAKSDDRQSGERRQRRDEQRPDQLRREETRRAGGRLMRLLDVDRDSELSAAEIDNAAEALKALDENGDGKLTSEELRGPGERRPPQDQPQRESGRRTAQDERRTGERQQQRGDQRSGQPRQQRDRLPGGRLIRVLDADGDNELSETEIENAASALKSLDENGDGKLTNEELRGPGDRRPRPDQTSSFSSQFRFSDENKRRGTGPELEQGDRRAGGRQQPRGDSRSEAKSVMAPGAKIVELADGFQFTEGPAADAEGNVFFTDIPANRIHQWSVDGQLSTFRENSGGANGLFFDKDGNLLACEGDNGRLVSINPQGNVTVLADKYDNKPFNKPNDLWIDPKGGIYFSDPVYGRAPVVQDGEHVYYLTPDRKSAIRVIDDLVRPNGIIGTFDGKTLYVTDHGAKKTYRYNINDDGTLSDKTLFAPIGADGMTIDSEGNIYLTENGVLVYDSAGNQIETIDVPQRPANVCFGSADGKTLFITARESIYSIRMRVKGVSYFPQKRPNGMVLIPGGEFSMGDHHDLGGREHRSDEVPIHTVRIDSFFIDVTEVTNRQYCQYLNSALSQGLIEVKDGDVYLAGGRDVLCETCESASYSRIGWDGSTFTVLDNKEDHPMIGVRWHGAVSYCNWLSAQKGYESCYDLSVGDRATDTTNGDFSKNGFRLPTEAEWEYAGRGGQYESYDIFPWGNDADNSKANWPNSGDPYETGSQPWTTPVGFYNGQLHHKSDFGWPGNQDSYQTSDGSNSYGLYDMAGNVWEWCNDWYKRDYYSSSPKDNPKGPDSGTPMRDGKPYHVLRSGNWYNGEWGHSRVANRNPAYYRGPDDPDHAWYHIGFRIVRNSQGDEH
jgi:sugar lactone lactonase YvrE/formylglycine-generating enzyme required for sulfatase activity